MPKVKQASIAPGSEASFATLILKFARAYGWRCFHVRNSGFRGKSFVQGDKGFPDIVMIRGSRGVVLELKVRNNKPSDQQIEWLNLFANLGIEAEVVYPSDWKYIVEEVLP